MTASYFSTLGVPLQIGRAFSSDEERPGSDLRVVIVGHSYWKPAGGSSQVLGTLVRLNGLDYSVVGVTGEGFGGTLAVVAPVFWLPTGVFDRVADDIFRPNRTTRLADPGTRRLMLVGPADRWCHARGSSACARLDIRAAERHRSRRRS